MNSSERAIEVSETYSPKGTGRKITIDGIPAREVTMDDESEILLDLAVCERIHTLIGRALRSNDAVEQRIAYSPPGRRMAPSHARRARR
jgi:hypothetical protein